MNQPSIINSKRTQSRPNPVALDLLRDMIFVPGNMHQMHTRPVETVPIIIINQPGTRHPSYRSRGITCDLPRYNAGDFAQSETVIHRQYEFSGRWGGGKRAGGELVDENCMHGLCHILKNLIPKSRVLYVYGAPS